MIIYSTPKYHILFDVYNPDVNCVVDQETLEFKCDNIPEEKVREYQDFINWDALCDRKFTFNFLREFRDKLTFHNFPKEKITREFRDKRNEF